MKKHDLLSMVGNIQQVAGLRSLEYRQGRAKGLDGWQIKNGPMEFDVMAGKCLDISSFRYRGMEFSFLAKPGLMGRCHFDTNGAEAQRSIMGGLVFTSGLENICAPCNIDGKAYPMHGRIRTTPAEHCRGDAFWDGDSYKIVVSGEMREAELFGENLVLRREISTSYGEKSLVIRDEIENQSFREEAVMLLYHFNFGYPLLMPSAKVLLPSINVEARDEAALHNISGWQEMGPPEANAREQVFIHELAADRGGESFAAIYNPDMELGMKITFSRKELPYFMQWKSPASGDYVMGLEPSNSSVYGRVFHHENNSLTKLPPMAKKRTRLVLEVIDGDKEYRRIEEKCEAYIKGELI